VVNLIDRVVQAKDGNPTGHNQHTGTDNNRNSSSKRSSPVGTTSQYALRVDLKLIQRLCADDKEALRLIRKAVTGKRGGDRKSENIKHDNVMFDEPHKPQQGNDRAYALTRLRKDRPDLHAKVLANDLSPHAAMVQAGFRPKTFTIVHDVLATTFDALLALPINRASLLSKLVRLPVAAVLMAEETAWFPAFIISTSE
jgi:hypothetical protein